MIVIRSSPLEDYDPLRLCSQAALAPKRTQDFIPMRLVPGSGEERVGDPARLSLVSMITCCGRSIPMSAAAVSRRFAASAIPTGCVHSLTELSVELQSPMRLTRLNNRRYLRHPILVKRAGGPCIAAGRPLSVLITDIDFFKLIMTLSWALRVERPFLA